MTSVVVSGFFVGLVYGLLGIGFVIVYRGSRVVNFAYGETGMVAAMIFADLRFGTGTAFAGQAIKDHGLIVALPVAMFVAAAIAAATEFVVVRPLRSAPRIQVLVGTLAVGALLFAFAIDRWGTDSRFVTPLIGGTGVHVGGILVSPEQLLILVVAVSVLVGLALLYRLTAFGLRLRAVALDSYAAGLIGINVNMTSMTTWALAGGLGGLSAILIAPLGAFHVGFMVTLTIRGMAAALVGGLTNIAGAFAAGVALGIAEGVIAFKSPISGITDFAIACCVLVLMVFRPTGLFRSAY
jgi:branched-chain amino acid transport system permease protein